MVLYLTVFLIYLSAKALYTQYGIVTLYSRALNYTLWQALLDISGNSYGQKLTDNQRDSPSLPVFINKIRKLNLADILINNGNCCNLCSQ